MRTPEELYEYETKRCKEYTTKIEELIKDHPNKSQILHLVEWYGKAKAIKSKAYQEIKSKL
jgi:hypothetical protein